MSSSNVNYRNYINFIRSIFNAYADLEDEYDNVPMVIFVDGDKAQLKCHNIPDLTGKVVLFNGTIKQLKENINNYGIEGYIEKILSINSN